MEHGTYNKIGVKSVILVGLTLLLTGCVKQVSRPQILTLEDYYNSIDYSCQTDADCQIKDVHNCCGYYPQCVNDDSEVNPELVSSLCAEEGRSSICGFPTIENCQCVNDKCVGVSLYNL